MKFKTCGGHSQITRRSMLFRAAALSNFALAVASRAEAAVTQNAVQTKNSATSCIFINLAGAPSHLDTFAPKDGPWNPADANLRQLAGGIVLSNTLFPRLSTLAGDLCILRSVASWEAAHERGQFYLTTSHSFNPVATLEIPHIGAVCGFERGAAGAIPPFVAVNAGQIQGSAILGGKYSPFTPDAQRTGLTTLQHYGYTDGQARFNQRVALLDALEAPLVRNPLSDEAANMANYRVAAQSLMYKSAVASTFQFTAEEENRYGANSFGRSLLVIRNLVRSALGATYLTTTLGGWDMHFDMWNRAVGQNMYSLSATLDRALTELVLDLKASGHLSKTLIVVMGEFGRTPGDLNSRGGRDHWRDNMCTLMLGGGVKGGKLIGDISADGSEIVASGWKNNRAIYVEDLVCTIYSALGINWTKGTTDTPTGKLFEYVPGAIHGAYEPVNEVFA